MLLVPEADGAVPDRGIHLRQRVFVARAELGSDRLGHSAVDVQHADILGTRPRMVDAAAADHDRDVRGAPTAVHDRDRSRGIVPLLQIVVETSVDPSAHRLTATPTPIELRPRHATGRAPRTEET